MWQVVVVIALLFLACAVDIAVGLSGFTFGANSVQNAIDAAKNFLRNHVVNQKPAAVAAVVLALCAVHSVVLSFMPATWMHFLRSDGLLRYAVTKGWAKKMDKMMHVIRKSTALSNLLSILDFLTTLAMLPLMVGMRLVLDPANSRLVVVGVMLPVAVAAAAWVGVDLIPLDRFVPASILESPEDANSREKQKILWVSAAVLLSFGGGYELSRRWILPGLARWFVGRTHPLAFLWGFGAAVGAALVLAGLHLDGNFLESPVCDVQAGHATCANGELPGAKLLPSPVPPTPRSTEQNAVMAQSIQAQTAYDGGAAVVPPLPVVPLVPRFVHLSALTVACSAVVAMHIGLPVFNRREYAVLRTLSTSDQE